MRHYAARLEWRAFFVGARLLASCVAIAAATAAPTTAQLRLSWDANAAVSQFDSRNQSGELNISPTGSRISSPWLEQRAMGGAFRYDHPFLQLNADGVFRDGDVVGKATGGMSALMSLPSWRGVRFSASLDARHVPNDASKTYTRDTTSLALWVETPRQPSWRSNASATLSYARNTTGLWLRAESRQGAFTSDSLSAAVVALGLSQQLRSVVVGFSVGAQGTLQARPGRYGMKRNPAWNDSDTNTAPESLFVRLDSASSAWKRWAHASTNISWARGRLAFDGILSARPRLGSSRAAVWGEFMGSAAVSSQMAFVGGVRTTAPLPGVMNDARRVATLGLRFASPAFWRPAAPAPVRAVSRGFDVQPAGPGQYVFAVNIPNARTVELAGDFTAWESVTLKQVSATRWEVLLTVAPGSHRCNVRVDGAEWVPPPGVPTVKDDFNGRVGLFVAE